MQFEKLLKFCLFVCEALVSYFEKNITERKMQYNLTLFRHFLLKSFKSDSKNLKLATKFIKHINILSKYPIEHQEDFKCCLTQQILLEKDYKLKIFQRMGIILNYTQSIFWPRNLPA